MSGRLALYSGPARIAGKLGIAEPEHVWPPRYNVAPGTWITGIRRPVPEAGPVFDVLWWGFRPHWAGGDAPQPVNARAENLDSSRYFRGAFHHHRCLLPADGWYEWLPGEGGKQPWYFCREDREPLFLAGLWEPYADETACCVLITEPARGLVRRIHGRMPILIDDSSLAAWLDPTLVTRDAIRGATHHLNVDHLVAWPVSPRVNSPTHEGPDLIEPLADSG